MNRSPISCSFAFVAASAGTLLVAACGGDTLPAADGATPTPSSTARSSTVTVASNTPATSAPAPAGATPTAPAPTGLCTSGDVKLALSTGGAAAGSVYRMLMITNIRAEPCTIQGFPGVSYVAGDDGHQVGGAAYRQGTKGDVVRLNTGQTAAADIQFVNVHNYDAAACLPTPVRGLRIYLPQETASNFVPMDGTGCASTDIPGNQLSVRAVYPV
ncbi:DUF4232 domain-containing protein [Amycolatopsis sp. NPDC051758]|uniref:DUF4232 domain-containing protein n=1 Tax=Amycolatopsis sp. NPDC051758 TaxID=3363935 RepID=UPI0037B35B02